MAVLVLAMVLGGGTFDRWAYMNACLKACQPRATLADARVCCRACARKWPRR